MLAALAVVTGAGIDRQERRVSAFLPFFAATGGAGGIGSGIGSGTCGVATVIIDRDKFQAHPVEGAEIKQVLAAAEEHRQRQPYVLETVEHAVA